MWCKEPFVVSNPPKPSLPREGPKGFALWTPCRGTEEPKRRCFVTVVVGPLTVPSGPADWLAGLCYLEKVAMERLQELASYVVQGAAVAPLGHALQLRFFLFSDLLL
ncbi:hypothetical protein D3C73_293490 [compost metagenome]